MSESIKKAGSLKFKLVDLSYSVKDTFFKDVVKGMSCLKKFLEPKYFYDLNGSQLFDKICKTKEYYPTRTEEKILKDSINEIISISEGITHLIELGSGSSLKTKIILKNFIKKYGSIYYYPIDVSEILITTSHRLLKEFPELKLTTIISEYQEALKYVKKNISSTKLYVFLGSSIGNYERAGIISLLKSLSKAMNKNDILLVGMDMVKDIKVLQAAYNDKKGFTRKFNLNILQHINDELDANFDIKKFEHRAKFNSKESRIEMHLVSKEEQAVKIDGCKQLFHFAKGESIHTENSFKFTEKLIKEFSKEAGLKEVKKWSDDKKYFSVRMFVKG